MLAVWPLARPTLTLVVALPTITIDDFVLDSMLHRTLLVTLGELLLKDVFVDVKRQLHARRAKQVWMFFRSMHGKVLLCRRQ